MADTTFSPNMSLPVPTVGVDPGPDWATNINASLGIIDSHNHSAGQGVAINPAGLDINSDLPMNSNNLTLSRSVNFAPQNSPISLPTDIGCIYVAGVDLYYNDENGNQIRMTQSGSVAGAAGTITGLPSGTASASFSGGTFTFQSATLTPANMAVGPVSIGQNVASSKTVTLTPNSGQASNYNLTFPAALPGAVNYMTLDATGAIAFNASGVTGSGANVLAASPTLSGLLTVGTSGIAFTTGTMVDYTEDVWSPTLTVASGSFTLSLSGTARYQRVGNVVTCRMQMTTGAGSGVITFTISLPILPTNNWGAVSQVEGYAISGTGTGGVNGTIIQATSSAKTVSSGANGVGSSQTFSTVFIYYINN